MAQGTVSVNNLNLAQGSFPEVERKALFLGVGPVNDGAVLSINTDTDLDTVLGSADSEIKTNVLAAKLNGGENWQCYAMPQTAGYDANAQIDVAMLNISVELIVICTPVDTAAEVEAFYTKAEALRTSDAQRVIFAIATPGIDSETQTWAQYETAQIALQQDVVAPRCGLVPQLHGNDLGVVVGRLCNHSVSIADSPMRTATGALVGLGATPEDSNAIPLPSATLKTLDTNRLSCSQTYKDYPGTYWGDFNLLDVPAGDYQVIENLRVIDKAARRVRLLAIARVADRAFNSTGISVSYHKTYFARPLREMSHTTTVGNRTFNGDIKPPEDDAVTIVWASKTAVEVYIAVTPYNSPKKITANIFLDLSGA